MMRFFQALFPLFFRPKDELAAVEGFNKAPDMFAKSGAGSNIIEGKYIQETYIWRTGFFLILIALLGTALGDRWNIHAAIATGGNHTYAVPTDKAGAATGKATEVPVQNDPALAEEERIIRLLFKSGMRGSPDGGVVSDDENTSNVLCVAACTTFFSKWHDHANGQDAQFRRDPLLFKVQRLSQIGNASSTTFDIGVELTETDPATGDVTRTETPAFTLHVSTDPKLVSQDNAWAIVVDSVTQDPAQQ